MPTYIKGGEDFTYSPPLTLAVLSFPNLVIPAIFLSYLLTLSPTILWRDTPELANVAYTLSIAHPAGFPTYSLLVKPLTFIPFGGIAFKTNLASALFSALSVVLFISTLKLLIRRRYPSAASVDIQISAIVASFLFALGPIVWHNSISTEVYTLNALFLAGLVYLILRWLDGFDPRWLYFGAFLYGLSAGNHATVALFLPALLALYLINRRRGNSNEWTRAIFFFLLGLSVYLYLPVRSLANPPYDWADPQNLENFLYQITDQKDFVADDIFPKGGESSFLDTLWNHSRLIAEQFTPAGIALILLGATHLWRQEKGFSLLFLWMILSNHAFFWSWTSGDAFLPSYYVLAVFLGVGTCLLLSIVRRWGQKTSSRVRGLVGIGLSAVVVLQVFLAYPKVNKRDYYLPADFYRTAFAALESSAVLLSGLQWFHMKYYQDVERLREDITVISLQEVQNPRAFHRVTLERYPRVQIPASAQTGEDRRSFLSQFLVQNSLAGLPIYWELTPKLFNFSNKNLVPHHDFLFRFSNRPVQNVKAGKFDSHFEKLWEKMLRANQIGQRFRDRDISSYFDLYIQSTLLYLIAHQPLVKQSFTLDKLLLQIYGREGKKTISDEQLSVLYNSLALSELRQGNILNGLKSLELAIHYNPKNVDPYLNLALWSLDRVPSRLSDILARARGNGLDPEYLCANLSDFLLKRRNANKYKKAEAVCRRYKSEHLTP